VKKMMISVFTAILVIALLGVGVAFAAGSSGNAPQTAQAPNAQETAQGQNVQEPSYQASVKVPEPEPQDLSGLAKINADQAKEAALKANPGATASAVELDNENGNLVWSVELSSGSDVKVDAGNGQVVHTEQPGADDAQEGKSGKDVEAPNEKPETTEGTTNAR